MQIKGYPVRLALDVALVFSANPEDYTARGKIVTPLKDRMGSEIRTHYPQSVPEGIAITRQECWSNRGCLTTEVADYIFEIVEQIAFVAREDKKVDKRSGVSQRLPISTMELAVSNAERRALLHSESLAFPRIGDIYTALPGITGKIELEYEGEMKGADVVVREIIRTAILRVYDQYFADTNTQQIEQWFNLGGTVKIEDSQSAKATLAELEQIQGLFEKLSPLGINEKSAPEKSSPQPSSCWKASTRTRSSAAARSVASPRRSALAPLPSATKSAATKPANTNNGNSAAPTSSAAA